MRVISLRKDATRKQRVNLRLDPDVAARLREIENSSAFVNGLMREKPCAAYKQA